MDPITQLIDRYLACWNEIDPARRRDLIKATWNEGATYVDPQVEGRGHDGIDAMIQGVQAQVGELRFRRVGAVDAHHDTYVRFRWELGPEGGVALAGVDFGVVRGGRLDSITGFFDFAPPAAAEGEVA
jgi:hypothetical protein